MDEVDDMATVETPTFLASSGGGYPYPQNDNGLILAALLSGGFNRDRDRNWGGEGCVTPSQLTAGLTGVTDAIQNTEVMGQLADIKAAVPLAEASVQLALAGTTNSLMSQMCSDTQFLSNGQTQIQLSLQAVQANLARDIAAVDTNVDRQSTAIQMAIKDDGEKTRALITANQIAELNRIAAERQDEIIELRNGAARDRDRHGIEINMINNQNQNQLQFQAQAQVLTQLSHILSEVGQVARATNQNLIVGNAGAVATGPQTANPVNVRA